MSALARRAGVAVALLVTLAPAAALADPPCAVRCQEMDARGELREGMTRQGCTLRVCQEEARRLYRREEHQEAYEALDSIRQDLAASPSYNLDLGMVLYALGRFDEALSAFDFVMGRFPASIRGGAQRGYTLIRLKRFADARKQFETLLEVPGAKQDFHGLRTDSFLQGNIGAVMLMEGDIDGGEAMLRKALESDGRNSLARTYVFRVFPALRAGAIEGEGLYLLMVASEDVGMRRFDRAEKTLDTLVSRWPKFGEPYALQSELLLATGRYEECERKLRVAEKQLPKDIDLRARRIRCSLLRHGPTSSAAEPARAEIKALGKQYPDNELIQDILTALDLT